MFQKWEKALNSSNKKARQQPALPRGTKARGEMGFSPFCSNLFANPLCAGRSVALPAAADGRTGEWWIWAPISSRFFCRAWRLGRPKKERKKEAEKQSFFSCFIPLFFSRVMQPRRRRGSANDEEVKGGKWSCQPGFFLSLLYRKKIRGMRPKKSFHSIPEENGRYFSSHCEPFPLPSSFRETKCRRPKNWFFFLPCHHRCLFSNRKSPSAESPKINGGGGDGHRPRAGIFALSQSPDNLWEGSHFDNTYF